MRWQPLRTTAVVSHDGDRAARQLPCRTPRSRSTNIEDLARIAFKNNAASDDAKALITALVGSFGDGVPLSTGLEALGNRADSSQIEASVLPRAQRVMLCARSESPFLHRMVGDLLRETWFEELGIDGERLSPDERTQATFIFGGLVAVLGSHEVAEAPLAMPALATSQMGRAAIDTLKHIAARQ